MATSHASRRRRRRRSSPYAGSKPTSVARETSRATSRALGDVAFLPALSETPGDIRWLGRALGADTDEVLGELLGRTAEQIAKLRADGVI